MANPTPTAQAPTAADDHARQYLQQIAPQDQVLRKRVFTALLRAVAAEGHAR